MRVALSAGGGRRRRQSRYGNAGARWWTVDGGAFFTESECHVSRFYACTSVRRPSATGDRRATDDADDGDDGDHDHDHA